MPTTTELRRELTKPGSMFEVITEQADGADMKVYKQRFGSLREVAAMAHDRGDRTFLVYGDQRLGFAGFVEKANSVSHVLASTYGIAPGDRVAVLSANNPEWCLAFWGTVDIGSILVGLNGWWKTDEIRYGLEDSGARVLIADAKRLERIADDLDDIPALEAVFVIGADPADFGTSPKLHHFDELLTAPSPAMPTTPIDEFDPAVVFYTSGTTGRPKGAVSTHRGMIANLQNTLFNSVLTAMRTDTPDAIATEPVGDTDTRKTDTTETVSLLTSPLFHVSGCHSNLVVGLFGGVRVVIPQGRFDPESVMELIEREHVTVWATVPTMVWRVCEHPDRHVFDLSSVTTVAFGGSPSAGELQRMVAETFPCANGTSNAYGLTESSSVATVISGPDAEERPASVGLPAPVVDLCIRSADGSVLGPMETGEVTLRGPIIMPGYWGKPEATAETLKDGWLYTGDVGHVDEDGYLFITDRAKDMIIRGGENVYCVEIENRLVEHPDVADAGVFGVPHPSLGEQVKAVVQPADGAQVDPAELRAWVAATLADFKVPTTIDVYDGPLPRNATGKLLKNLLRGSGDVSLAETL